MAPRALLIDFGGVLTSDVFASFAAFCEAEGLPPDAVRTLLRTDEEARRLLVEHECGRLDEPGFDAAFAARLSEAFGVAVAPEGLIGRMSARLEPDEDMLGVVPAFRAAGIPVVLVSNTLGYGAYEWCDLDEVFDHVVLSGRVGTRKPSRAIYRHAAGLAGVPPEACVMVDDLEQNLSGAARLGIRGILHRRAADTVAQLEVLFGLALGSERLGELRDPA